MEFHRIQEYMTYMYDVHPFHLHVRMYMYVLVCVYVHVYSLTRTIHVPVHLDNNSEQLGDVCRYNYVPDIIMPLCILCNHSSTCRWLLLVYQASGIDTLLSVHCVHGVHVPEVCINGL